MTSTTSALPKERASLSTPRIVFLVIAAAAPLASMIGNLPIALGLGNGAGTPGAFAIAGVILLCFAVGYAAMSRRIVATGAFYTYISEGLGAALGVSSAYTALLAYVAFTFGLAAFFGYFTELVIDQAGLHLPWMVYALVGILIVAILGYRSIDLSSAILGALMIGEVIILAIFDIAVIHAKGFPLALPANVWNSHIVFTPGLGVSLMVAFTCFVGFESAALYGEEARDPKRSIPIATYTAVISIAVFYLFTAWVTVGAIQPDAIAARANKETGELMFNIFTRYGGEILTDIMGVLVCFSILASYLAIHNAASRYIFALGREWLLLPWFGEAHPKSGAPHRASMTVSLLTLVAVVPFALTGLDPFKAGVPVLIGFGSFGIIFLQTFAAIAILVYLHRHGGEPSWVIIATWLGAIGLVGATIFVGFYFNFLATSNAALVALLPLVFPVVVVPFAALSVLLKFIHPKVPASLQAPLDADAEFLIRGTAGAARAWTIRYRDIAGREITSDSKPSFESALADARALRDQRGAQILELVGQAVPEADKA